MILSSINLILIHKEGKSYFYKNKKVFLLEILFLISI